MLVCQLFHAVKTDIANASQVIHNITENKWAGTNPVMDDGGEQPTASEVGDTVMPPGPAFAVELRYTDLLGMNLIYVCNAITCKFHFGIN